MTGRRTFRLPKPLAMFATAAFVTSAMLSSASAGEHRVKVGEVRSEVARGGIDMPALLRTTAESELAKIEGKTRNKRRAVLSIALLQMNTESSPKGPLDVVRVEATIRDASKGALLATFQTSAKSPHSAETALGDKAMVQSAVQGIVHRVPEALK